MQKSPLDILQKFWNYNSFKEGQEEIIQSILQKKDTIALLPTGGGKSICYQIPALLSNGICVVVSPLLALIKDQIQQLENKNIRALSFSPKMTQSDIIRTFDNLKFGKYKFLYISPERLQSALIQEKLKELPISFVAIDEAHCISEWGHDFRPSYLQIKKIREIQPNIPIVALTATATNQVLKDIAKNLEFKDFAFFKKSFYKKNLAYQFFNTEDKISRIEQILQKFQKKPIIIYTNNRIGTEKLSNYLNQRGFSTSFFHAGMSQEEKDKTFENWFKEKISTIIATNAFGMGIDKSNVRVVIHYTLPNSIENYVQEAGRAGRDLEKAFSAVLYNEEDLYQLQTKNEKNKASVTFVKEIYKKLNQFFRLAIGEIPEETFLFDLQEFCNIYNFSPSKTFNAFNYLERENIIEIDRNFNKKSTLQILVPSNYAIRYIERDTLKSHLLKVLIRNYGGLFDNFIAIDESILSKKLHLSKKVIIQYLEELQQEEILEYRQALNKAELRFLVPREDDRTINRISKTIEQQNKLKKRKIEKFVAVIEEDEICRSKQILDYFSEKSEENCGICDVCISKKNKAKKIDFQEFCKGILTYLQTNKKATSREIISHFNFGQENTIYALNILLEKKLIRLSSQNKFELIK
ncbi:RecQ family ATP-dependent DNA helicase [Aureivirga marina]|uniref:RecQ family ATP-dependent DNA helicase n=1 Tax=Aureivirga marina TaxID=1182451 RepID=UPI0018C96811|nr:RecQ family ATP-dependent DNA helicase [Aureivirga marina]